VKLAGGKPDPKATVVALPRASTNPANTFQNQSTDAGGRFEFVGLQAGEYSVGVSQRDGKADLMRAMAERTVVTVTAGEVKELEL
jgi:uncharacterized GH25 family protein